MSEVSRSSTGDGSPNLNGVPVRAEMSILDGVSVVIPTLGRQSLAATLGALATGGQPAVPVEILLVDDRRPDPDGRAPAPLVVPELPDIPVLVIDPAGPGEPAGPAAARNRGWRAAQYPWVAFLDDDVVPDPGWWDRLVADLQVPARIGGVQGRVRVPYPPDRRPTDWERSTAGLAGARWITADMAYRRAALAAVGGFDERFPRAYREDTELAYRIRRSGWQLLMGERTVVHPVRPEGAWASLAAQRGNADDALLRRLYGPDWRLILQVPAGRRHRHALATAAGAAAGTAAVAAALVPARRARLTAGLRFVRGAALATWAAGTAELAAVRIAPGPRTARELATMAATSALIPPLACLHWLRGWLRHRRAVPIATVAGPAAGPAPDPARTAPAPS